MTVKCGDCKHFHDDFPMLKADDDEQGKPGSCEWPIEWPHAFRYCGRERMGVHSQEESECPQFQDKINWIYDEVKRQYIKHD